MTIVVGLDAGGTKTLALIADDQGRVLGSGRSGPGNWEGVGLDGAHAAYAAALGAALAQAGLHAGDLAAAGYALAGLDWPSDQAPLDAVVARLGIPGPRIVVNDAFGALRAGAPDGVGVAIIAGTGSTVAGCNAAGERFRTFGLGHTFGDWDGASSLTGAALRAVSHAYFGRGPATALTTALLAACAAPDVPALAERFTRSPAPPDLGALAPVVMAAAAAGDAVALAIVRAAGDELGSNAAAVAQRLGLVQQAFPVVGAGGVFTARNPDFAASVLAAVQRVAPAAILHVLDAPPVLGAVLLGFDAAGVVLGAAARARLVAGCKQVEGR